MKLSVIIFLNNSKLQYNETFVELNWEMKESILNLNITELDSQVKQENMIPIILYLDTIK